jgi:hypothetical protein
LTRAVGRGAMVQTSGGKILVDECLLWA